MALLRMLLFLKDLSA
jgi:transposase